MQVQGMTDWQFEAYLVSMRGRLDVAVREFNEKGTSSELVKLRDEIRLHLKKP